MTKRELDWADEEVNRLLYTPTVTNIEYSAMLAQALRSAHRRGMEEAEKRNWHCLACPIRAAIERAAIKNEEQPQEPKP